MENNCSCVAADISLGPWGYQTGEKWSFKTNQGEGIKQIIIKCGLIIDFITFKDTQNHPTKFGGNGGDKTFKINIDFPREYLTGISGTHGSAWFFPNSVTSLTFITNKTQHGPFGTTWGTDFSVNANDAVVTGFHGRCGKYVDGIGLYIKPVKPCDESDNGVSSADKISLKAKVEARIADEGFWKIISENLNF